ncbi:MAG: DNA gyrase subunit A [Phycisphaerales bacterium]|nr:DNA gyrase subunit A [Phycisphaerales bacterium]
MDNHINGTEETNDQDRIVKTNIEEIMKTAYIDYSMSVIVGRALPDVRDGLKPVHRRILFAMNEIGMHYNKPYKKSARIVGEVLGKYHPHGDSAVYNSLVRMAQEWSMRYTLIDGQGNFGNQDGDSPAAMRYTEARLEKFTDSILSDIDKETVDFQFNFDDSLQEPTVLPTRIPQLLVNGSEGIAVGMATVMVPHNLNEVVDGCLAYIKNRDITIDELMKYIIAPDFPTGGTIYGMTGVHDAMRTGRGRVVLRGTCGIEKKANGREEIVITTVPYQVNRDVLTDKIAQLVNAKTIEGVLNVNNESNKREGTRIVVELKKEAISSVIINQLYKYTELESSFGINNVAICKGKPKTLNLKDLIVEFINFRMEVIIRRTEFELRKAQERAHILKGYLIAIDILDQVIKLIRASNTREIAETQMVAQGWGIDEIQAKAICALRLYQLTGMERQKIQDEYDGLIKLIAELQKLLDNESERYDLIAKELLEVKEKFGDARRTKVEYLTNEFAIEDMIANEDVVVTISHLGYTKRTPVNQYRQQKRGGRGSIGSKIQNEDFAEHLFVTATHSTLLIFTQKGRCFWLKVHLIPDGDKNSKGRAIQNLISLPQDDKVKTIIDIPKLGDQAFINSHYILLCTKKGIIKKMDLADFQRPRTTGIFAIAIKEQDELFQARMTDGNSEILVSVKSGRALHFPEEKVRSMGRNATGVRSISLANDQDEVVGLVCINRVNKNKSILVISEKGIGKKTRIIDEDGEDVYRLTNRTGKGVITMKLSDKTGKLAAMLDVEETEDLLITCKSGLTLRTKVSDIKFAGRNTQGVYLIRPDDDDIIVAISTISEQDDDDKDINTENTELPKSEE